MFSARPHHSLAKEIFATATVESPAWFCRATQQGFLRLAGLPSSSPKVWMDACLAAFAILHGAEFITLDRNHNGTKPSDR